MAHANDFDSEKSNDEQEKKLRARAENLAISVEVLRYLTNLEFRINILEEKVRRQKTLKADGD